MPRDAGEFLCESCGYSLAGVAMRTACPECGREAALSDGARRAGSPWQQRPSPRAWLVTNARTLASPRRIWDDVRISAPSTGWLLAANLGVSAGIVALALAQGGRLQAAPPLQHLVAFFVVAASIFAGFTGIEYSGLRAFGHRRAWRTTRAVALAACAHASVGWLVGAVLLAAVWTAAQQDVVPWLSGAAASPQSRWSAWGRPLAAMIPCRIPVRRR